MKTNDRITPHSRLPMTGIVLAGGKSSRMGTNKVFLEYQGRPLIQRNLETLRSVFSQVLISSNNPELFHAYPEEVIPDQLPGCGPLGGLGACLEAARYEVAFFLACDMPFVDAAVIRFMAGLTPSYDVTVPWVEGGLHPLHAFYRKSCLPVIKKNLEAKDLKIINFYPQCQVRIVQEGEFGEFPDVKGIFRNINTPEDWAGLQSR